MSSHLFDWSHDLLMILYLTLLNLYNIASYTRNFTASDEDRRLNKNGLDTFICDSFSRQKLYKNFFFSTLREKVAT